MQTRLGVLIFAVAAVGIGVAGPASARENALFCQLGADAAPYYVQLFNPTQPPGICTAADRMFSQEEFRGIPGLKRQCVFDRDEQIAQKHGIVSIYSSGDQGSIAAARAVCEQAGNAPAS